MKNFNSNSIKGPYHVLHMRSTGCPRVAQPRPRGHLWSCSGWTAISRGDPGWHQGVLPLYWLTGGQRIVANYYGYEDVKCGKSSVRQCFHAYPINLQKTLGPSAIHSMPSAPWRDWKVPDSPPTDLDGPNLPTAHQWSMLDHETESE